MCPAPTAKMEVILLRNKHSAVSCPSSFFSAPGSRIHTIYGPRFDGKTLRVVPEGQEDIQELIEAWAPFCDINYMLQRLKIGDSSVLSSRMSLYGDFSFMPDNPVDAINLVRSAERRFAELPADEKKAFNNDYRVWLSSVVFGGSNSLDSGSGSLNSDPEPIDGGVSSES